MQRSGRSRKWPWIAGILLILVAIVVVCIRVVIVRAQPILRARVIDTLSARFKSRVELGDLHVWVADGVDVDGKGLKIYGPLIRMRGNLASSHYSRSENSAFR